MSSNLNEWVGEGNIATDVVLRHTKDSARPVLNMILFIDSTYRAKKNTNADHVIKKRYAKIPLVAWHKKAEYVSNNFQKGDKVRVKGTLRTRVIKRDELTYSTFEIVVSEMLLLNRNQQY